MNKEILFWKDKKDLQIIARELQNGKSFLGTSDTVFGLLATATEQGIYALNSIKGRTDKPYIILIGGKNRVHDYADRVPSALQVLIDICWPGPLTIIVKAKDDIPKGIVSANGTIALRVPKHEGLLDLLSLVPALFSTSANKAGMPVPYCIQEIDEDILEKVVAIITDGPAGCVDPQAKASTILDCTLPDFKVIREGAYSLEFLEHLTGKNLGKP